MLTMHTRHNTRTSHGRDPPCPPLCLDVSVLHHPWVRSAAQLFTQFVQAARARDERSKKRKIDAAVEETRQECREYLEQ